MEKTLIHFLCLRVVANKDDVDLFVVPCQKQVECDEEALDKSLRCWSIEPDTSIKQNITAWLVGSMCECGL